MMRRYVALSCWFHVLQASAVSNEVFTKTRPLDGLLLKSEVPSTGEDWMSVSESLEVQLSSAFDHTDEKLKNTLRLMLEGDENSMPAKPPQQRRRMEDGASASKSSSSPYQNLAVFADSEETFYDAYAQAWRYLGYYIDCGADGQNQGSHDGRRMEEDGVNCVRYLLWAAYVDPEYQGNGLYEYQFYDRYYDEWTSYCADEDVCRKMDCHLSDTSWKLMGIFKHADFDDWVEQLFKHEGVCIWTEDEFDFMYEEEELFDNDCTATDYSDEITGTTLYSALRPMSNGDVGVGLYTDYRCSQLYDGDYNVYDIVEAEHSGDDDLNATIIMYNEAFSIYKICQPCIAYDLENNFQCDDEAGYTNVNQCMKFSSKARRRTATVKDIAMAATQNSLVEGFELMGISLTKSSYEKDVSFQIMEYLQSEYIIIDDGPPVRGYTLLGSSMAFASTGVIALLYVIGKLILAHRSSGSRPPTPKLKNLKFSKRTGPKPLKEPLVPQGEGTLA